MSPTNAIKEPSGGEKKESILELTKMIDAKVHVKCLGGRELVGILKGYDELVNLVLDDADEFLRGKNVDCSCKKCSSQNL